MTSENAKIYHEKSLQNEICRTLSVKWRTKYCNAGSNYNVQEKGGLQLSQVSLSMVKSPCKCGHGLTSFLLGDTSENIPIEVECEHEKW